MCDGAGTVAQRSTAAARAGSKHAEGLPDEAAAGAAPEPPAAPAPAAAAPAPAPPPPAKPLDRLAAREPDPPAGGPPPAEPVARERGRAQAGRDAAATRPPRGAPAGRGPRPKPDLGPPMTAQEHWAGDYDAPLAPALVVAGIKPLDGERDMWTSYAAVRRRRSRRLLRAGLAVVRPAPPCWLPFLSASVYLSSCLSAPPQHCGPAAQQAPVRQSADISGALSPRPRLSGTRLLRPYSLPGRVTGEYAARSSAPAIAGTRCRQATAVRCEGGRRRRRWACRPQTVRPLQAARAPGVPVPDHRSVSPAVQARVSTQLKSWLQTACGPRRRRSRWACWRGAGRRRSRPPTWRR